MPDDQAIKHEIEVQGQITPPRLSDEALAHYRELLARPGFEDANPEWFAMLQRTVDEALSITGQQLTPADPRSVQQRWYDERFAMEPSSQLVEMCRRDAKAEAPNPEQTAKTLAGIGMAYKDALELAQHAVSQSKELAGVKVENLPPITLASLARFGELIRRLAPKRPQ